MDPAWNEPGLSEGMRMKAPMKTATTFFLFFSPSCSRCRHAAFCGFYVAKADASLFNQASQVVYVRDENKNALTLSNDFKGELTEFALVVPVPEVLKREQIHVGERALVERVDAFSAPRLVEFFDPDPCNPRCLHGLIPWRWLRRQ